jgi:3-methylcrotonyl-CoA carboxylase alpha subunit
MEMNTRLQVEHPVTEMTLGLDLVEWQLRVAAGEPLPLRQDQVHAHGHAIEVRLYAEDPEAELPARLRQIADAAPALAVAHVRLDGGVIEGDTVTIFYDPMIAKLIVFDAIARRHLQRLREALAACEIVGPKSNIGFLERLARHPAVVEGASTPVISIAIWTNSSPATSRLPIGSVRRRHRRAAGRRTRDVGQHQPTRIHPGHRADAWRIGHAGKRIVALTLREQRHDIEAHGHGGNYQSCATATATCRCAARAWATTA